VGKEKDFLCLSRWRKEGVDGSAVMLNEDFGVQSMDEEDPRE
jgi:hypothetical protein